MKRTAQVTLSALFLALAAACTAEPDEPEYSRACGDAQDIRVEDDDCERGSAGFQWWYFHRSHTVAPVGSKLNTSQGSVAKPNGSIGSVSRGGFGGRVSGGSGS